MKKYGTDRFRGSFLRLILIAGAASLGTSYVFAAGVERTADSETASLMEWPHDGNPNDWHMCCGTSGSYEYLQNDIANGGPAAARNGNYFLKLTRKVDDPPAYPEPQQDYNRVEVTTAGEFAEPALEERWFGMSMWVPSWVDVSGARSWNSIGQWHGASTSAFEPGVVHLWHHYTDRLQIDIRYGVSPFPSDWWNHVTTIQVYDGPMPKDQWLDFVFHYKFDNSANGFFRVWLNGTQIVNYSGPYGFWSGGSNHAYVKLGSYAKDSQQYTRTYYYDEVRWGGPSSSYESVSPASYGSALPGNGIPQPNPPIFQSQ